MILAQCKNNSWLCGLKVDIGSYSLPFFSFFLPYCNSHFVFIKYCHELFSFSIQWGPQSCMSSSSGQHKSKSSCEINVLKYAFVMFSFPSVVSFSAFKEVEGGVQDKKKTCLLVRIFRYELKLKLRFFLNLHLWFWTTSFVSFKLVSWISRNRTCRLPSVT